MKRFNCSILCCSLLLSTALKLSAFEYQGIKVIAHRGAGFEIDENTIEACKYSYDKGIRGFEVDIRRTKDGRLVLMHDDTLKRTTSAEGNVETLELSQLADLRTVKDKAPIPTVESLFDYFSDKPDVIIELEMKTSNKTFYPDSSIDTYAQELYQLAKSKLPEGTYLFTSFDDRPLKAIKRIDPNARIALINGQTLTQDIIQQALSLKAERLAVNIHVSSRHLIREAQKAGLLIAGWPTRDLQDIQLAVAMGVNTFTTDVPSLVLEAAK